MCVCVCVKNACVAQRRDIIYALVVMCGHTVFRYRIELACSNTANPITTQIADCDFSFRLRNRISNINFRHIAFVCIREFIFKFKGIAANYYFSV